MKLRFQVTLCMDDGRVAAGKLQASSKACPCGHCWCGATGSGADVEAVWNQALMSMVDLKLTKPMAAHGPLELELDLEDPQDPGTSTGPSGPSAAEDQQQPVANQASTSEPVQAEAQVSKATSNPPTVLGQPKPRRLFKPKILAFREFLSKYRRTRSATPAQQTSSNNLNRSVPDLQQPGALEEPKIAGPSTSEPEVPQQNLDSTVDSERSFRVHVAHYYKNRRRRAANLSFLNSSVASDSVSSFCFSRPPTTHVTRARHQQQRPLTPFPNQRIYECEQCSRTYVRWANLQLHKLRSHQGVERFRCVECPRSFETHKGLKIHDAKMHPSKDEEEEDAAPSVIEDSHYGSAVSDVSLEQVSEEEGEEDETVAPPSGNERAGSAEASPPEAPPHQPEQLNTLRSPSHSPNPTTPPTQSGLSDNETPSPDNTSSCYPSSVNSMESNDANLPRRSVVSDSEALVSVEVITLDDTCDSSYSDSVNKPCSSRYHGSAVCTHANAARTPPLFKAPGLPCLHCPLTFKEESALAAHRLAVHDRGSSFVAPPPLLSLDLLPPPRLRCRLCPLTFSNSAELGSHQHIHLNSSSSWGESDLYTRRQRRPEDSFRRSESAAESRLGSSSFLQEGPKYTSFSSVEEGLQISGVSVAVEQSTPRCLQPAHARRGSVRIEREKQFGCPYCPARMDRGRKLQAHIKRQHRNKMAHNLSTNGNVSMMSCSNWRR